MPAATDASRIAAVLPMAPRDYLILFVLADGALHGHGLLRALEAEAKGVPFDPANLYRSLRKLERDGLIAEAKADGDPGGPARRAFRLTRLGRGALSAEASRLTTLADAARQKRLVPAR